MKSPTTDYQKAISTIKHRIDEDFLFKIGFEIIEETPLLNTYKHRDNNLLIVCIGLYGELTIMENHWLNGTPEKIFSTINPYISRWEFNILLKYLNINTE